MSTVPDATCWMEASSSNPSSNAASVQRWLEYTAELLP